MKATTILKRLGKKADEKRVNRTSSAYKLVKTACETGNGFIRPCWTSGHGRFCKNMDYTADVVIILGLMNVQFGAGNDAPKGGKCGNYIKIKHFVNN